MLTMFLGGLWHGANWTFRRLGPVPRNLLALHKAIVLPRWAASPILRPFWSGGTFLCVCVGWVFFRRSAFKMRWRSSSGWFVRCAGAGVSSTSGLMAVAFLGLVLLCHLVPQIVDFRKLEQNLPAPAMGACLILAILFVQLFVPEQSQAFIYFQF